LGQNKTQGRKQKEIKRGEGVCIGGKRPVEKSGVIPSPRRLNVVREKHAT